MSTEQTTSPEVTVTADVTPNPEDRYLGDYEGIEDETYHGPTTPSAERQEAAYAIAGEALEAYFDVDQSREDWFAQLRPYLSATARVAYETVDPARVPATDISGDPFTVRADRRSAMTVAVPTSAGDVQLDLVIEEADHPWVVDRIRLPQERAGDE